MKCQQNHISFVESIYINYIAILFEFWFWFRLYYIYTHIHKLKYTDPFHNTVYAFNWNWLQFWWIFHIYSNSICVCFDHLENWKYTHKFGSSWSICQMKDMSWLYSISIVRWYVRQYTRKIYICTNIQTIVIGKLNKKFAWCW